MPVGVQSWVSWAICHLLFSLSLRARLCEQWEQICPGYICKIQKKLTWGTMLWLSQLGIYFLIMWNFEKACGEEAKTERIQRWQRNTPSYPVVSQHHLQEEWLSFLIELWSNNTRVCSQCFTAIIALSEYCKFILKILEDTEHLVVVFFFYSSNFCCFFSFFYFKILPWLWCNNKKCKNLGCYKMQKL